LSDEPDELKRRISILEARTGKLEERVGLLSVILFLIILLVILGSILQVFIYPLGLGALGFAALVLILYVAWRTYQSSVHKARMEAEQA